MFGKYFAQSCGDMNLIFIFRRRKGTLLELYRRRFPFTPIPSHMCSPFLAVPFVADSFALKISAPW